MAEFGKSSAFTFRGWVRLRVLGYGFGVRGRKVKSSQVNTPWRVISKGRVCHGAMPNGKSIYLYTI